MSMKNSYNDNANRSHKDVVFPYIKLILLPLVIYIFVLLGFFEVINFKVKLDSFIMISIMLVIAMILALNNASFAYSSLPARVDDFKAKLKDFIVLNLLEIAGVKKSNVCFDEFLESYTKDFRNENFANIVAPAFATLGILGTFISIAVSMPTFISNDTLALERDLGLLLNGVGTAFYISIYGIFLSLWWIFFEKCGLSKFQKFTQEQREISRQFFWQKNELEQRFMSIASQHFNDIRSVFSRISNEEFFKNLDNVVGNKFKSYSDLQSLEQRMIGEAQIKIDQNIRLLNKAGVKQDEFVKIHTEILKATINLNTSLKEMQSSFSNEYNRLNELMQDKVNGFEKSVNKFDQNLKNLDLGLKNLAIKVIEEQNQAMSAFRSSMLEGVSAFKAVYDQEAEPSKTDLERNIMLENLKKDANELDNEIQRVMKNLQTPSELLDEIK